MRIAYTIFFFILLVRAAGQTLGGNAAYNFLKLPSSPMLTASGGVNVSWQPLDVGLSAYNPALLSPELNGWASASFNSFLAGIKAGAVTGAYYLSGRDITLGAHIYFIDYGSIPQTDAAGNISGTFRPVDFVIQVSGAKQYLNKWHYGFTLKYIRSKYQLYSSQAVAMDAGVLYKDSVHLFSAGLLARNMGLQLKSYAGSAEDLPFDIEAGITKKLANAPLGFSLTAQHLHQFDIVYSDSSFAVDNSFTSRSNFFKKLFNHFILAAHIYIGSNLEAIIGYNQLRRYELNAGSSGNGLNGFSAGVRIKFEKIQIQYALADYQRNFLYHQFGIALNIPKLNSGL